MRSSAPRAGRYQDPGSDEEMEKSSRKSSSKRYSSCYSGQNDAGKSSPDKRGAQAKKGGPINRPSALPKAKK